MSESNEIPQGVKKLADFIGIAATDFWNGTVELPGLKTALTTPEKVATFDRIVEETVAEFSGKRSKQEVGMIAMDRAGEAILGPDRPVDPNSTEALLEAAVASGILRRV